MTPGLTSPSRRPTSWSRPCAPPSSCSARCSRAPAAPRVSLPGGCAIGVRPIDQHLKGLEQLGAEMTLIRNGYVEARASAAQGRAHRHRPGHRHRHREPHDGGRARGGHDHPRERGARAGGHRTSRALLTAMGARIHGAGTERIEIEGVPELGGARHRVIPDRIEAGTLLVAAAITGGDVHGHATWCRDHLSAVLGQARGVRARRSRSGPTIASASGCGGRPRPTDVVTSPYPGFPTDMQAQFMALLGLADGLERDHRDDLREPLHARGRARAAWARGSRSRASIAVVRGVPVLPGRAGDGHRPARLRRRWCSPASPPRARPRSRASTTSTAATSDSSTSSRRSARGSGGSADGDVDSGTR